MYLKSNETTKRYSLFPIQHQDIFTNFYKKAVNLHWTAEQIDLSKDDFNTLSIKEKQYLKNLLAFFAVSDGIVIENLALNFIQEVDIPEIQYFYVHQAFMEQIHAETYSLIIDTYITDKQEQLEMFNAVEQLETVKKKAKWALDYISNPSFAVRLVAFALVEGLAFSSTFAGVFWFKSRNKLNGLAMANDEIIRDENLHYEFANYLYKHYLKDEYKLDDSIIREMILSCYEVEKTFVDEAMPDGLDGLTKQSMIKYVQFIADGIAVDFGLEPIFNANNPLEYMNSAALPNRNNFFERRGTEYTKVEIPRGNASIFTDDF